jgi:spore coat protein A
MRLFRFNRARLPLVLALVLLLPAAAAAQTLLDPAAQPKFVNPLPNPLNNVLVPDPVTYPGYDYYHVTMRQVRQQLGLVDPVTHQPLWTTVWGYDGSYPGPTFEARKGRPVKVLFTNDLVDANGNPLPHLLPLDTTLDCGPLDIFGNPSNCRPFVRTVPHLHGGHVADHSDGNPEAWFTAGFAQTGPKWSRQIYDYPNDQEAATLWYHDHAMGITRLNVYAGLAGFYLLRDDNELRLQEDGILPWDEVPIVIQDRSFYSDGSLAYPADPFLDGNGNPVSLDPVTGQPVPSITPEFFGDFILVNGVAWPYLNVEPQAYRFRILNGSDSRFYTLGTSGFYRGGFAVVGGDGGFLNTVTPLKTKLVIAPGERVDVVMDFSGSRGQTITLTNTAPTPYPGGTAPNPATSGKVLQLRVSWAPEPLPWVNLPSQPYTLRDPIVPLTPTPGVPAREVLLAEGTDPLGRILPQLGTSAAGPLLYMDPVTETPRLGTTETWTVINTTMDAHPVHLHLVQFQVINRQPFDTAAYVPGQPNTLAFTGNPVPPLPQETGWKDTVKANPGEVTRVIARFDLLGDYVWHCHILSHEDHEMMRPLQVVP